MFDAIKSTDVLSRLTLTVGNPYASDDNLGKLVRKEEKVLLDLLTLWEIALKKNKSPMTSAKINAILAMNCDTIKSRYSKKIKEVFESLNFSVKVLSTENDTLSLQVESEVFGQILGIEPIVKEIILHTFGAQEWFSANQYLLEKSFHKFEIIPGFKSVEGHIYSLSGSKLVIDTSDILTLLGTDNWPIYFKHEPSDYYRLPEGIKYFNIMSEVLKLMVLLGSQTMNLRKSLNAHDQIGQSLLEELESSYMETLNKTMPTVNSCIEYFDELDNYMLSGPFISLCEDILELYSSREWLDSTSKVNELLENLYKAEFALKRMIISIEEQEN